MLSSSFKIFFILQAGNNSKLTGKYIAGRGRALKEFSRTQPKAEVINIHYYILTNTEVNYVT